MRTSSAAQSRFVDDCIGQRAEAAIKAMQPGEIVCLENTRFHPEEEKNDPGFVAQLAALGDVYVNDAFSAAHRAHASTEGLAHKLPAYAGRAMQAELEALEKALEQPQRPVVAIVGGAKISTKLDLLGNLLKKVDVLIIGGAMANTFLLAHRANRSASRWSSRISSRPPRTSSPRPKRTSARSAAGGRVVARKFEAHAPSRVVDVAAVAGRRDDPRHRPAQHRAGRPPCWRAARRWSGTARSAPSRWSRSTTAPWRSPKPRPQLTQAGKLVSVAGGGDTVAALNAAGAADRFTYVSTAGGAFLEWMEGKPLPGVEALRVK